LSLEQVGSVRAAKSLCVGQLFTFGVLYMKVSLVVLVAACAIASPAFAAFDIPPTIPPHAAVFDIPPTIPPHAAFDIPPTIPPHAAVFDIPPTIPPQRA
jgi:hypothetical protein